MEQNNTRLDRWHDAWFDEGGLHRSDDRPRRSAATLVPRFGPVAGHRHGHRKRLLTGTFVPFRVPGWLAKTKTTEWKSQSLRDVSAPHPGRGGGDRLGLSVRNNTRRVRPAVFAKGIGKDIVIAGGR